VAKTFERNQHEEQKIISPPFKRWTEKITTNQRRPEELCQGAFWLRSQNEGKARCRRGSFRAATHKDSFTVANNGRGADEKNGSEGEGCRRLTTRTPEQCRRLQDWTVARERRNIPVGLIRLAPAPPRACLFKFRIRISSGADGATGGQRLHPPRRLASLYYREGRKQRRGNEGEGGGADDEGEGVGHGEGEALPAEVDKKTSALLRPVSSLKNCLCRFLAPLGKCDLRRLVFCMKPPVHLPRTTQQQGM
jgi:hypothetical protein